MCTEFGKSYQFLHSSPRLTGAFSVVALVSMAFGIIGIIACACCKDVDKKMNSKVCITPSRQLILPQKTNVKIQIEVYLENTEMASRNKYH
jgi:hypothetical protein